MRRQGYLNFFPPQILYLGLMYAFKDTSNFMLYLICLISVASLEFVFTSTEDQSFIPMMDLLHTVGRATPWVVGMVMYQ